MSKLYLKFKGQQGLHLGLKTKPSVFIKVKGLAVATQEKTVIPADYEQTITADEGFYLSAVKVEKIPSNYGKITFNGSVLTVS